jgi:hypothetical protein
MSSKKGWTKNTSQTEITSHQQLNAVRVQEIFRQKEVTQKRY